MLVLKDEDIKCNQHATNTQAAPHSGAGIRCILQSRTPIEEITGVAAMEGIGLQKGEEGRRQLHIIGPGTGVGVRCPQTLGHPRDPVNDVSAPH